MPWMMKRRLFLQLNRNGCIPYAAANGAQSQQAYPGYREHSAKEIPGRKLIAAEKKKVLRVPHRRSHTANVGGDGLKHDGPDQQPLLMDELKNEQSKGDKGDQGNVVGDQHGSKEGEQHHRYQDGPCMLASDEEPIGHAIKQPAGF